MDLLAIWATSLRSGLPRVIIDEDLMVSDHSDQTSNRVHSIQVGPSWMDPLVSFLRNGSLPEDNGEVEKFQRKAPRYWLSKEQKLYKHSYSGPYLLCIHLEL